MTKPTLLSTARAGSDKQEEAPKLNDVDIPIDHSTTSSLTPKKFNGAGGDWLLQPIYILVYLEPPQETVDTPTERLACHHGMFAFRSDLSQEEY